MANPTCTSASLNVACFRGQQLSKKQKLATKILFAANELSVIGGTNYTNLLNTTLVSDANSLLNNFDKDAVDAAELAVYYNNAVSAGATVSTDPNANAIKIQALNQLDDITLQKMLVTLLCQLGRHKSYPQ